MSGYRELKAQADELMKRVEEARLAELEVVIQEVRNRVAEYGLTASQIFGRPGGTGKRGARGTASVPRYRDPKTGATWNGRGREPGWIKGGRRERFLIERNAG
ncbi:MULTISPECIES: H-NS histone family protein [Burkholderia]|uniref:H-NS histone family protein n=1 Tax=Burkholderia TaxID=32008 RepID=UPI0014533562|nr:MULTISPECIES: H-NS histone family protein [Burkholderia]MBN3770838.1 H-NS histone family protein [Burkholderia sp. Se-20378]VWL89162.1 DNA-binding protein [Burkholderia lata]